MCSIKCWWWSVWCQLSGDLKDQLSKKLQAKIWYKYVCLSVFVLLLFWGIIHWKSNYVSRLKIWLCQLLVSRFTFSPNNDFTPLHLAQSVIHHDTLQWRQTKAANRRAHPPAWLILRLAFWKIQPVLGLPTIHLSTKYPETLAGSFLLRDRQTLDQLLAWLMLSV